METVNEKVWTSRTFYGHPISAYGLEHGYVDYRSLSYSFDMILANELLEKTQAVGYWEPMNGSLEEEIFQWYIIDERGADILKEWTDELLLYNEELNLWLWGVAHWGTAWDYVLTNIRIEPENEYGY